jgi:hypothetical protein
VPGGPGFAGRIRGPTSHIARLLSLGVRLVLLIRESRAFLSGGMGFVARVPSCRKDSSSSGLFRVKVYNADAAASAHGTAQRNGTGMFPREIVQKPLPPQMGRLLPNAFPLLPLEEEGQLNRMPLRENSIERVIGLRRKATLSAWQFGCGKLHDRMAQDAGRVQDWQPSEDCQSFGTLPHGAQADPRNRHTGACFAPRPTATGQAQCLGTTPRWAAWSPTPGNTQIDEVLPWGDHSTGSVLRCLGCIHDNVAALSAVAAYLDRTPGVPYTVCTRQHHNVTTAF